VRRTARRPPQDDEAGSKPNRQALFTLGPVGSQKSTRPRGVRRDLASPAPPPKGRRGRRRERPNHTPQSGLPIPPSWHGASLEFCCWLAPQQGPRGGNEQRISYLVDPASSHMLVSKIKPCMSKYRPKQGETANGSLNQLWFIGSYPFLLG
jgi:hypothetical protein